MKMRNNRPNEEHVVFSSVFKIIDCLTGRELKSKSAAVYILADIFLDPVSMLPPMIKKDCS